MTTSITQHILLGKFRPEMTAAQYDEFIQRFCELTKKIPGIVSFEYGENNSPEGKDLGMTHVILLTFTDAAARDAYLVHPDHIRFGTWLGEANLLQDLVVVDFTPQTVDPHQ